MSEEKRGPGRPKGSGEQKPSTTRAKESRAAKLDAGGERYEVVISATAKADKDFIMKHRAEFQGNKTTLFETLLAEEAKRLKRKRL